MLSGFAISQRGESHGANGLPCQDSSACFQVPSNGEAEYVVAVVADGVGSEACSDSGSAAAVEAVTGHLKATLAAEGPVPGIDGLIGDAFEVALDAVFDLAEKEQEHFSKFASTLTVAVYNGSDLWYGHAGDDGIVAMWDDGSYALVTERHKGAQPNSVIPFGMRNWQFGEAHGIVSCVLMTDGVLDYCVGSSFERNRVWLPFLKPLLYAKLDSTEAAEAAKNDWSDFLAAPASSSDVTEESEPKPSFRDYVRDDLTVALLTNSEAVAKLPEYDFDTDAWAAETERISAAREEVLERLAREHFSSVESKCERQLAQETAEDGEGEPPTRSDNAMQERDSQSGNRPLAPHVANRRVVARGTASTEEKRLPLAIAGGVRAVVRGMLLTGEIIVEVIQELVEDQSNDGVAQRVRTDESS